MKPRLRSDQPSASESKPVFDVRSIKVDYSSRGRTHRALDDVSVSIHERQSVGLIGESGSGKSTLCRSLLGLIPPTQGVVEFDGVDIYRMKERARHRMLGQHVSMVFQDPRSSLNPRLSVGAVVGDPLRVQGRNNRDEIDTKVEALLESVGLPRAASSRPVRSLSGGQLQRVALARALSVEPRLIVADEPTSALDVSVQAQILNLLKDIRVAGRLGLLVVSHDIRVIRFLTDWVAVMHNGVIVEAGPTEELYGSPTHEYTKALLNAMPKLAHRR